MITFEEAFEIAKQISGRDDIDVCNEDKNAYVFAKEGEITIGGELPIPILKNNGKAVNMLYFVDNVAEPGMKYLYTHKLIDGVWRKEKWVDQDDME